MKKTLKFTTITLLLSILLLASNAYPVCAAQPTINKIQISPDLYCITEIYEETPSSLNVFSSTQTKSGSKTVRYENASGTTLWYVKVTASFTYNGSSSTCTSASVTADSHSSNWSVSNKSSWKSGDTGYASATGHLHSGGEIVQTISRTVSLKCSNTGVLQ